MEEIRFIHNIPRPASDIGAGAAPLAAAVLLALLVLSLSACSPPQDLAVSANSTLEQGQPATRNMNAYPLNKVVCDPWSSGTGPVGNENGIRARLGVRGTGQPAWTQSSDYVTHGQMSAQNLFFSDLFVPTRMFDQGFATQTSSVVANDQGEKLIEYFGLRFQTQLRLTAGDVPGDYEFAILSDDGTTMTIDNQTTLISNEGTHPSKLGCGTHKISLAAGDRKDLDITYYQGPRLHISMILLWRPASATAEPLCGSSGNHLFFDPDHGSNPQQAYKDLLARHWAPVPARNFFLPGQQVFNPCVQGEPLEISGFAIKEVSSFQAELIWQSSRPATSQVLVRKVSTNEERLTDSDQILRTTHELRVEGLESDVTYELQAVSVADDGAKALGPKIVITTP